MAKAGDKPVFAELARDRSLLTMAELGMTLGLHRQAVKLQYNAGAGGCFPMHFDSDQELEEGWLKGRTHPITGQPL